MTVRPSRNTVTSSAIASISSNLWLINGTAVPPAQSLRTTEPEMIADWDGVHADELFPDSLVPVCRPDLIWNDPVTARDIAAMPLIHTTTRRYAWPDWLRIHDARLAGEGPHPLEFGHFFMSPDAARGGWGLRSFRASCSAIMSSRENSAFQSGRTCRVPVSTTC